MLRFLIIISVLVLSSGFVASSQNITDGSDDVVVILGDSNTWLGHDDCSGNRAWTYEWVRYYAPASARSYARSGATWTNVSATKRNTTQNTGVLADDNTIYNQVERLAEDVKSGSQEMPTLIIIMAGTNDAWFASKRPGAFDMSAADAMDLAGDDEVVAMAPGQITSIALAVRNNVCRLERIAPYADIVLVGPLQSVQAPDELIAKAGSIIEDMGQEMELPVIRLDRDFEINSAKEAQKKFLTTDGTHTSVEGARRLGAFIADRIRSLGAE